MFKCTAAAGIRCRSHGRHEITDRQTVKHVLRSAISNLRQEFQTRRSFRLPGQDVEEPADVAGEPGDQLSGTDPLVPAQREGQAAGEDAGPQPGSDPLGRLLPEPFGLAVLEAAQAGCPLVLSDIATFRELWDGAALFFPPGDDATLANLLTKLALDPDLSASQGCAARTQAARYTLKNMTKATRDLYAALSPALSQPHGVAA